MEEPILSMEHITKIYSNGFVANKDVTFSVYKGEIVALAGENGAGKTTLMKILFGIEMPSEGRILLNGAETKIDSPIHAIKLGIGMVHQHFMLGPSLTVAENIVLGVEPVERGLFSFNKAVQITKEISEKYNLYVDPYAKIQDLPVGLKQKVEILKALLRGAKILILDEPTAVLTPQETSELFVQLKNLKNSGYTIIFISHKLQEVVSLCDRIAVLRNGSMVAVENIKDVTEQTISRMMVGRDVILKIPKEKAKPKKVMLKTKQLSYIDENNKKALNDVSLSVRQGEILGVAGVEGNGQRELSEIITKMIKNYDGAAEINGQTTDNISIKGIRSLKTSHISEDRMTYGVVSEGTIYENIISDRYDRKEFGKGALLDYKVIKGVSEDLIRDYNIKCDSYDQKIGTLSGGNMQKVVAAREFSSAPELIIANQPTRGIDVGASEFIRKKLIELRDRGTAILLISADLNEVLEVSDSIIVMHDGEIAAYFQDTSTLTEDVLGEYMLGIKKQSAEEIAAVADLDTLREARA